MSRIYYHVTETASVAAILDGGLAPRIGPLARMLDEPAAAIYLFTSEVDADTALGQWLGEAYEELAEERGVEEIPLTLLVVRLPEGFPVRGPADESEFEAVVYEPIPASCIEVLRQEV